MQTAATIGTKITTIQNWCESVWLATLTLGASPQLALSSGRRATLPFLAIGTFWLLAAFQFTFAELDGERALRIERILLKEALDEPTNRDAGLLIGHAAFSRGHKALVFFKALLLRETITWFVLVLSVATVGFMVLIR